LNFTGVYIEKTGKPRLFKCTSREKLKASKAAVTKFVKKAQTYEKTIVDK
jgi:hypothetical protein